ncbi:MAG TPA: septum formation initiator family protein [Longimicrobiales bacterium]
MKRRNFLFIAVLGAALYFALFGGEYGLLELRALDRQRRREALRLEELRHEVAGLRARADSLASDSATLERIARERYGLIKDGERLYRFVQDTSLTPSDPDSTTTRP